MIFLEDELNRRFGAGAVRVICPITDPFVRHHGALGSFVRVYARDRREIGGDDGARAAELPGVDAVFDRAEAAARYELPYDREADLVVPGEPLPCSAPPAPSTICRRSPGIGCARMAERASSACRSCCRGR